MISPDKWKGYIRGLEYVVLFETDPSANVKHVVDSIINNEIFPGTTIEEYLEYINIALTSDISLSELPQPYEHTEETIRIYLENIKIEIEKRLRG